MPFSYMNSVQLNRKVVFIHMQSSIIFNFPGAYKVSQSLYKKFVLLLEKMDPKNAQCLSKENYYY